MKTNRLPRTRLAGRRTVGKLEQAGDFQARYLLRLMPFLTADILSWTRVVAAGAIIALSPSELTGRNVCILALALLGEWTDWVDGGLARLGKGGTVLGRKLDPAADFVFRMALLYQLWPLHRLLCTALWFTSGVIAIWSFYQDSHNRTVRVNNFGKVRTWLFAAAITILMVSKVWELDHALTFTILLLFTTVAVFEIGNMIILWRDAKQANASG